MRHVKIDGVDCYGEMSEEYNVAVTCDDEGNDYIHCDGFKTWTEAVKYFKKRQPDVVGLSAI